MNVLNLDTLAFANRLKEAGADGGLAEAIASGLSEVEVCEELATKADLAVLATRDDLRAAVVEVKAVLKDQNAALSNRIYGVALLILLAVLFRPYLPLP